MTVVPDRVENHHRHLRRRCYDADAWTVPVVGLNVSRDVGAARYDLDMDIPDEDIDELTAIWKDEFGVVLTRAETRSRASVVLDLLLKLTEPLPSEHPRATNGGAANMP